MHELRGSPEPGLDDLLATLSAVDLVLVEGFKGEAHPKVSAHRVATGKPPICDPGVRAIATDSGQRFARPTYDLDDTRAIASFILAEVGL